MPVDLAEHDVAGEDHEFRGRAALVGDRQRPAGGVEAERREQPLLVEVPAVGDAGMQAVAGEIVHLVDVDRSREQRLQDAGGGIGGGARDQFRHAGGSEPPVVGEHRGHVTLRDDGGHQRLVPGQLRQPQVLDRVAVGPVAHVVQQRRGHERRGVGLADGRDEPVVAGQPPQKLQRQPVGSQRVLEPGVHGPGIDECHETELRDPGEPPQLGGVQQPPHPRRQRDGHVRRNPDAADARFDGGEFGKVGDAHRRHHGGTRRAVRAATDRRASAAPPCRARRTSSA